MIMMMMAVEINCICRIVPVRLFLNARRELKLRHKSLCRLDAMVK